MRGQAFHRAVLDQDASKGVEGLAGVHRVGELAEDLRDDRRQKGFDGMMREPLAQSLFAVGGSGGPADDGGDTFQGEVRFRSQRQEGLQELRDGNFARGPVQKAGGAGEGFRVQVLELGEGGGELLLESIEKTIGIFHGIDEGL